MKKVHYTILIIAAAAALAAAILTADLKISPYVSISEARSGKNIQFIGYHASEGISTGPCTRFSLSDRRGECIEIEYCGALPENFHHAEQIAAAGSYDTRAEVFRAEKLLYKCPTKYSSAK